VFAHVRRVEELTNNASEVHYVTQNVYLDSIPEQRRLILEHGQRQEVIIAEEAFEVMLENPAIVDIVRELLETENMTLYLYRDALPVAIGLIDDVATILPYDDQDFPCALIETKNETIRNWVSETIDDYRAQAEQITAETLQGLVV
jgi:predicted transcriptional regulator